MEARCIGGPNYARVNCGESGSCEVIRKCDVANTSTGSGRDAGTERGCVVSSVNFTRDTRTPLKKTHAPLRRCIAGATSSCNL